MAASTRAFQDTGISIPKWQLALAIGAPVAVGLGVWYYYRRSRVQEPQPKKPTAEDTSKIENGKAAAKSESVDDPFKKATIFKNSGNKYFKEGKYAAAIKNYQQAIEVCPKDKEQDISTFYQNMAAAYEQLKNYDAVIRDCTEALRLNPKYIKALHRRAKAEEVTNQLEPCLEDITAVCILEKFQNQSSLLMADRVLKELGKVHAREAVANRKPVIPSKHFINSFMSSFSEDPVFCLLRQDSIELPEGGFTRALDRLKQKDFGTIIDLCTEEIESGSGDVTVNRLATLLRGTFLSLLGEHEKSLLDLTSVFEDAEADPKIRVNALVKRATLRMQMGVAEESLHDLLMAAELGPDNADVYHHRGQVYMLMDKASEAMEDFARAVSLKPTFSIAVVQKLYTDYRLAVSLSNPSLVAASIDAFQNAVKQFPDCPECYLLYAQVLSDQQEYKKADDYFKKALEVDPLNATAYVHRGLLQLQWEGKVDTAISLIEEAIRMDSKCEFAYETLGTIEVQRGNLKRAIELFDLAIPLSKTEVEISHLFSLKDAALAQLKVADKLGVTLPSL